MADEDWTVPKKLATEYTDPYQRDHDKITVTRGYIMWLMHEAARLSANVQVVELKNNELKAELAKSEEHNAALCERMQDLNSELHTCSCANANMNKHMNENARLKAEVERLQSIHSIDSIGIEQLKAEVERLTSDLQMEKENEDRLVREWQRANNEVYGLQRQVAALIDDQTRLKAEVERLTDLKAKADGLKEGQP
jgi:chromosome segregation ATPase